MRAGARGVFGCWAEEVAGGCEGGERHWGWWWRGGLAGGSARVLSSEAKVFDDNVFDLSSVSFSSLSFQFLIYIFHLFYYSIYSTTSHR